MDERTSQFITTVGDICASAQFASLDVEIVTAAGARTFGVPGSVRPAQSTEHQADESGYARTFRVDDHLVNLDDVVRCTLYAPSHAPG